ncbi:MAG: hypothetical protein ABIQ31_20545 [Ferruginibacter sp.]
MPVTKSYCQAELMPWGNINGIRINGQLMKFSTSLNVVKTFAEIKATGKERQKPRFSRNGNIKVVNTVVGGIHFTESVENTGMGACTVKIRCEAEEDAVLQGLYLGVQLPKEIYSNSQPAFTANGMTIHSRKHRFSITASDTITIVNKDLQLYLPIVTGSLTKGQVIERSFRISVTGEMDESPAEIILNNAIKGRRFAGLGGNFRLQNATDSQVIAYCLRNLRVAWGRVEMPWKNWHPDLNTDPTEAASNGRLDVLVSRSMRMARTLNELNIPVIVSAWSPPAWAVEGPLNNGPTAKGIWGNPLDQSKMPDIYKSITDYLIYLKMHYGVAATYFSFNESDIGINVRQTAQEHNELIKGLGAYFISRGLKTKLLLGDNSDANSYAFIYPALKDSAARKYIGAVSFHSWRGWDSATLQKWTDAATQINSELIVGEGSIDAAAWQYPAYFEEESYALEEINLYIRLLAICQPLSILQWQLTADYSLLKGGGIFGDAGPLAPTRRFWQLKQLADTRAGLLHIPVSSNRADISCAALAGENNCTLHIVNNSGGREMYVKGVPAGIRLFQLMLTDQTTDYKKVIEIPVNNGQAVFRLPARSYVTLTGSR